MSVDLDSYRDETVYLAFWLQDKLYKSGIEGHGFMQDTQSMLESEAGDILEREIEAELRKL